MKKNANLVIRGKKVILIPYKQEHVETYHEWMQDPYLQESTASDVLTLKEEYRMQQTWLEDEDKCTFILLDPDVEESEATEGRGGGMVGDVNLFLNDPDSKEVAEIEVMVAERGSRRKGLAYEALVLFMMYAITELNVKKFVAKIGFDNNPSQRLFGKLGFVEKSRSTVFREVTVCLEMGESARERMTMETPQSLKYERYS